MLPFSSSVCCYFFTITVYVTFFVMHWLQYETPFNSMFSSYTRLLWHFYLTYFSGDISNGASLVKCLQKQVGRAMRWGPCGQSETQTSFLRRAYAPLTSPRHKNTLFALVNVRGGHRSPPPGRECSPLFRDKKLYFPKKAYSLPSKNNYLVILFSPDLCTLYILT